MVPLVTGRIARARGVIMQAMMLPTRDGFYTGKNADQMPIALACRVEARLRRASNRPLTPWDVPMPAGLAAITKETP